MIIVIGTSKGGDGKSTIATNLSAMLVNRGKDAILVDADPQASSYTWNQRREEMRNSHLPDLKQIVAVRLDGKIREQLLRLQEKYEYLIVDTQGRESFELVTASLVANKIIMPYSVGFFDMWALAAMTRIVEQARLVNEGLEVLTLVNRASTNARVSDRNEFQRILNEYPDVQNLNPVLLDAVIRERRIYRSATGYGLSVEEVPATTVKDKAAKNKAVEELAQLYEEVVG
jgi:chromosome partitioning protein